MIIDKYPWLEECINQNSINNFPPASVIEGEVGLAKLQLALYFAKQLLCLRSSKPCSGCNSCSYFEAQSHPDYCYLTSNSASSNLLASSSTKKQKLNINTRSVDGIRAFNQFMWRTNSVSTKRVGIIFDGEKMNLYSQNALLKILEESSKNKFIIIVASKRKFFLPTIYSRASLISIKNPTSFQIDKWIKDQGYIDYSTLNFSPDTTPLNIETLINENRVDYYQNITSKLNLFCINQIDIIDLIKFFKDLNISYELKINSIITYLKICLGILTKFYNEYPLITSIKKKDVDIELLNDLVEELVNYKVSLNKVPALNEQIGLNYFFSQFKGVFK